MEFPGFLGNDEVKRGLQASFSGHRFPHAILLQGERGVGKRTLARLIAQALVCRDREHPPCGTCPSCIRALAGSHPDIRVVEGSGATRSLSVETVRGVIEDCYRKPQEAECSVYLLFTGTRTLEPAQNKLLKVVEEPPDNTIFLLVCEQGEQLLPTIRSRAQSFLLQPPSLEEARQYMEEKQGMDSQAAAKLATLCNGNLGRMLEEAQAGDGAQAFALACSLADSLLATGEHSLLKAAVPLQKDRHLYTEALRRLRLIFRDALVGRSGGKAMLSGAPEQVDRLSALPLSRLVLLPEVAQECLQLAERNANMALLVTCLCARLRTAVGK